MGKHPGTVGTVPGGCGNAAAGRRAGRGGEGAGRAGRVLLNAAYIGWPVGQCQNPEAAVKQALAVDKSKPTQIAVAATQAFCGEGKLALPALDALEKKYPDDTLVQQVFVPQGRAYVALQAGDAQKALDLLAKSQAFDLVSPGPYLRGLAYLQLHDAGNATAAFKIATKYKGASYTNVKQHSVPHE
jgi:predicted Zn-dependent protease